MKYNFDEIIDRTNTNSLKYDFAVERGKPDDILPLWVADMDFRTPKEVIQSLTECAEHGVFGYTDTKDDYFKAVQDWFSSGFNFDIEKDWVVKTPGVVFALSIAINSFTKPGDGVLIQQPVYYPFFNCIRANGRRVINNSLVYENGTYHIDFEDFEKKIAENNVKMFLLCSPHNPVGRVWSLEELTTIGKICMKYNCLVVSDEIHCDFVYQPYQHHIFSTVAPEFQENSIICTAPSKTFNLAGLQVSNIFIPNEHIRKTFVKGMERTGYSQLNTMGLVACQSAYQYGGDWLKQLKTYLSGNLEYVRNYLREDFPQIKLIEPQGTYLIWLDCKELGLTQKELDRIITFESKLWLDSGTMFGTEGEGFQRVNIACPRDILASALMRLQKLKEI